MKKLWYVVIVVAVIYLGWEFFRPRPGEMQSQTSTAGAIGTASLVDSVTGAAVTPAAGPVSVTYSATGFSPQEVTVKKGEAVMWTNVSPSAMWVSVNPETGYDGTARAVHCAEGGAASFDQCVASAAGSQWSFTFNKAGVWKYRNHEKPDSVGTVVVTE